MTGIAIPISEYLEDIHLSGANVSLETDVLDIQQDEVTLQTVLRVAGQALWKGEVRHVKNGESLTMEAFTMDDYCHLVSIVPMFEIGEV